MHNFLRGHIVKHLPRIFRALAQEAGDSAELAPAGRKLYRDLLAPALERLPRTVTTLFVYIQTAYEIPVLAAVFLFGWLLERRHGHWAPLLVFLVGGAGGMFLAIAFGDALLALGANGAALALLCAWVVRDLLGRRQGRDDDSDLLGVLAIAVVLVLLPLATTDASALAGLGGAVIGLVLGLGLARLPEH